jgi:uncharacterized membrane protein SpoIIM required for sporulation
VDLDRFLAANEPGWRRLGELTSKARGSARHLTERELDELLALYERTSTQLSLARGRYGDPGLNARLSRLVAGAGAVIYGARPRTLRGMARFFTHTFPAALWRIRPFIAIATFLTFAPALVVAAYFAANPAALEATSSPAERAAFAKAGADYYSAQPSAVFASEVFTNNVRVALVAFTAGIAVCLFTVYILVMNGLRLGQFIAVFVSVGKGTELFGLLVPHGFIELSAVIVAGAAGLRIGWTVIDPGDLTRPDALAVEGTRSVVLVFGAALMLVVAGLIEGFVTGSALPTAARIGLGVAVGASFWTYAWVCGRRAAALGLTGALGEETVGWMARPARRLAAARP